MGRAFDLCHDSFAGNGQFTEKDRNYEKSRKALAKKLSS